MYTLQKTSHGTPLASSSNKLEIDHETALYEIKNKLWYQILKDYNLSADKLLNLKKK